MNKLKQVSLVYKLGPQQTPTLQSTRTQFLDFHIFPYSSDELCDGYECKTHPHNLAYTVMKNGGYRTMPSMMMQSWLLSGWVFI